MPWFKVDDQLATHPKVMKAGLAAMGLWVKAGSWSAQHLTDGRIPADALAILGAKHQHADALVKAGLWAADENGWHFRDWLEYQPSAADVRRTQEESARSGRRGNHKRWHVQKGVVDESCPFCQEGER